VTRDRRRSAADKATDVTAAGSPGDTPAAGGPTGAGGGAAPGDQATDREATDGHVAGDQTAGVRRVANRVGHRVAHAIEDAADVVEGAASAVGTAASVVGSAASVVGSAASSVVEGAVRRFEERPGARVRRVRRLGHEPLPQLDQVHPDARNRTRRELGLRTIELPEIAGTAVGGGQQRGGDFLPLKPFRTPNWQARWQRLGQASDRLVTLPPIDALRYGDRYWVVDGHNRVGMALYSGQASIDADVIDLVDPANPTGGPAESFASLADDSRDLRAAVRRTGAGQATGAATDPPEEPPP
jgi:hypothetical protein